MEHSNTLDLFIDRLPLQTTKLVNVRDKLTPKLEEFESNYAKLRYHSGMEMDCASHKNRTQNSRHRD